MKGRNLCRGILPFSVMVFGLVKERNSEKIIYLSEISDINGQDIKKGIDNRDVRNFHRRKKCVKEPCCCCSPFC